MIRYTLKCARDHRFESWFQSVEAFDTLRGQNLLSCPDCGSAEVEKTIMAPRVRPARKATSEPEKQLPALSEAADPREQAIAEIRRQIEENSDYVGLNFANEARAIHDGDAPARTIHGEAKPEDAKKLLEDGVPVAPLPFVPRSKTN